MSGQLGTGAEVSYGHFGTSAEMSWVRSVLGPKCLDTIIIIIIVPLMWLRYTLNLTSNHIYMYTVYVYKYNEQPVSQDSNNTRFSTGE